MAIIRKVHASRGLTGYYFDDLYAIKAGAKKDGFFYVGEPQVPGQYQIRQPGESISIMLELDTGDVAYGDAVAIQYSGVVGRDPVLLADEYEPHVSRYIAPALEGRELSSLRDLAVIIEDIRTESGAPLHVGLRYGASQAVLHALSLVNKKTMAEVAATEYGTSVATAPVPILAQSGDDRHDGADKMILKSVPAITQGLFNTIEKFGEKGENFVSYVEWLRDRVQRFGKPGYHPTFHLDIYGFAGRVFNDDVDRIAEFFEGVSKSADPFKLRIEDPVDPGTRDGMRDLMADLRSAIAARGGSTEICVDEWCNTLEDVEDFAKAGSADMIQIKTPDLGSITNSAEAVNACRRLGVQAFLGGTCNGTDQSTRVTVNLALALQADLIYNKPGMGVDEGVMIVTNEMNRVLKLVHG